MELLMREAGVEDLDGLDRVMLVISDNSADRNKMAELVEKLSHDPQKYLLVAEDLSLIHI